MNNGAVNTNTDTWRGSSMEEVYRNLPAFELAHVANVSPSAEHTVLHRCPIRAEETDPPTPHKTQQKWDSSHVRLPCSAKSQYPVMAEDGNSTIESRWEMVEKALLRPITNSHELQAAILSYNTKYEGQWNFNSLHRLFEQEMDESEACVFFEDLLPRIIRLALRLPELVQAPIPLLKQGRTHSLTLTQQQISCLLANAFLCTFPRRNTHTRKSEYSTFPEINFNTLFQSRGAQVLEKIKCICHYFRRVCPTERDSLNVPTGVVTFTRRSLPESEMPRWSVCEAPLSAAMLHITSEGTIEDQGLGLLQVDFANKFLGGGVLGTGCVQEEIRFVICPELLVSKLFTECMRPNEALLMVGSERYSDYTGYGSSFKWAGNHEDGIPRDSSRRRLTHIIAIDALPFSQSSHQFREELLTRELNKAYVGFMHPLVTAAPGVASGNWGCGAFGGEATLKALLQLLVCTVTQRPLVYYTFGDAKLCDAVHQLHQYCIDEQLRVKDVWAILKGFGPKELPAKQLYSYIYESHRTTKQQNHSQPPPRKTAQKSALATIAAAAKRATSRSNAVTDADRPAHTAVSEITDIFNNSSSSEASDTIEDSLAQEAIAHDAENQRESKAPNSNGDSKRPAAVAPPSTKLRQRSLLEMLDTEYAKGVSGKRTSAGCSLAAAKRPCKEPE